MPPTCLRSDPADLLLVELPLELMRKVLVWVLESGLRRPCRLELRVSQSWRGIV
jgi:hypothetical protein